MCTASHSGKATQLLGHAGVCTSRLPKARNNMCLPGNEGHLNCRTHLAVVAQPRVHSHGCLHGLLIFQQPPHMPRDGGRLFACGDVRATLQLQQGWVWRRRMREVFGGVYQVQRYQFSSTRFTFYQLEKITVAPERMTELVHNHCCQPYKDRVKCARHAIPRSCDYYG